MSAAGLGNLAGLTWATWALTEQACLLILRGRLDEAIGLLEQANEQFELLGNRDGAIDARSFLIPALRLLGDDQHAAEIFAETRADLARARTYSRFRHDALLAEEAELARAAAM